MSDENQNNEIESNEDPIQNLKAELSRKMGNYDAQFDDLKKTNEALLSQLQNLYNEKQTPTSSKNEKSLADIMYDDPEEYTRIIEERAVKKALDAQNATIRSQQEQQTVINNLINDYPELNQNDHGLTIRAVEIFNSLSDTEKNSNNSYRLAVREAASELGIKPKSKRKDQNDNFSFGSKSSGVPTSSKESVDDKTTEFAKIMGLDVSKKELKEKLSKERNWNRYE